MNKHMSKQIQLPAKTQATLFMQKQEDYTNYKPHEKYEVHNVYENHENHASHESNERQENNNFDLVTNKHQLRLSEDRSVVNFPENITLKQEEQFLQKDDKMRYKWCGCDENGKNVVGVMYAKNHLEICKYLQSQNIFISEIKLANKCFFHKYLNKYLSKKKNIPQSLIADFMRELAFMINANMPLLVSLNVLLQDLRHQNLKTLITAIAQDVESGHSLTYALQQQPKYFLPLWCNLINVGEQTGSLPSVLQYIAKHITKSQQQYRKVMKALLYPSVILLVAMLVTILMLVFVMPKFQEMYTSFGSKLPVFTQLILNCSEFVKRNLLYGLISFFMLTGLISYGYKKSLYWQKFLEICLFKLPIFGKILHKHFSLIMAWTLYITTKSGMQLCEALNLCANNIANWHYKQSILSMRQAIIQGNTFYQSMLEQNLFSEKFLQLVALGEESGNLTEVFLNLTNIYEEDINYFVENLNNLLEPMLMLILGLIVGGLIVAMYLPLFKLGGVM